MLFKKFNNNNFKKILFSNGSFSFIKVNNFKLFDRFEIDFYNNNLFTHLKKINEK